MINFVLMGYFMFLVRARVAAGASLTEGWDFRTGCQVGGAQIARRSGACGHHPKHDGLIASARPLS